MRLATSQAGETTVSEYEALAKNVIRRTLHIQPKENVIVETWNHGLPIATEVVYQVRAAGARPFVRIRPSGVAGDGARGEFRGWSADRSRRPQSYARASEERPARDYASERNAVLVRPSRETRRDRGWDRHQGGSRRGREHGKHPRGRSVRRPGRKVRGRHDRLRSAHRVARPMDPRRPSRLRWRPDGEILGFGERGSHPVRVGRGEGAEGPPWIPRHR